MPNAEQVATALAYEFLKRGNYSASSARRDERSFVRRSAAIGAVRRPLLRRSNTVSSRAGMGARRGGLLAFHTAPAHIGGNRFSLETA